MRKTGSQRYQDKLKNFKAKRHYERRNHKGKSKESVIPFKAEKKEKKKKKRTQYEIFFTPKLAKANLYFEPIHNKSQTWHFIDYMMRYFWQFE